MLTFVGPSIPLSSLQQLARCLSKIYIIRMYHSGRSLYLEEIRSEEMIGESRVEKMRT